MVRFFSPHPSLPHLGFQWRPILASSLRSFFPSQLHGLLALPCHPFSMVSQPHQYVRQVRSLDYDSNNKFKPSHIEPGLRYWGGLAFWHLIAGKNISSRARPPRKRLKDFLSSKSCDSRGAAGWIDNLHHVCSDVVVMRTCRNYNLGPLDLIWW